MVRLSEIRTSNHLVGELPAGRVALFVGATSGIGEAALKAFAGYANSPRIYFLGRSQEAADRIVAECKALNGGGEYIFVQADVSLLRVVDQVCSEIQAKEEALDLLFLSQGVMDMSRKETPEGIHLLASLNYYSRVRFITNLLPLLRRSLLRRVVTIGGGGMEGPIDLDDLSALHVPLPQLRGHLCTLVTLGLEQVAKTAPTVSFVHVYPGSVNTGLYRDMKGPPFDPADGVPLDECGERQCFVATSARYPPRDGGDKTYAVKGTTGQVGGGVYSIGCDCESEADKIAALLADMRRTGADEAIRQHTESEIQRVTEPSAKGRA